MAKAGIFHAQRDTKGGAWKTLGRKTLDAGAVAGLVKRFVKGKFAEGSVRRAAERIAEQSAEGELDSDVLFHEGDVHLPGDLVTFKPPSIGLLVVQGDLVIEGDFHSAMDPEAVVVVTGDLRARNVINGAFLEVHGNLVASNAVVFTDNDPCSEILGDVKTPFLLTKYHSARVHGAVRTKLYTGDDDTVESKAQKKKERGFVEETELRVRDRLSPALLKKLSEEMFDDDEDGWIDYVDDAKVITFLRKGGVPLK